MKVRETHNKHLHICRNVPSSVWKGSVSEQEDRGERRDAQRWLNGPLMDGRLWTGLLGRWWEWLGRAGIWSYPKQKEGLLLYPENQQLKCYSPSSGRSSLPPLLLSLRRFLPSGPDSLSPSDRLAGASFRVNFIACIDLPDMRALGQFPVLKKFL